MWCPMHDMARLDRLSASFDQITAAFQTTGDAA
jgi:hypothetical protein